jgi:hypothetical protein
MSFIIFLSINLLIRLINIKNALYFTWDQGRDFFAISNIVQGNLTLIGPTTGIQGFFLGPFWYYLGVPGRILSQGNPYIFSLWYVLISLSALPLFWFLSKKLFQNKKHQLVCAYGLGLVPASLWGLIMVWNPMISIALISGFLLSLIKAQKSRLWLFISFLLLALVLQSEFAYGAAILLISFVLIYKIRSNFNYLDYLISGLAIFLTLIPQFLFEIKHNFLMLNAINRNLAEETSNKNFIQHLLSRTLDLLISTKQALIGDGLGSWFFFTIFFIFLIYGLSLAFKSKKNIWQIIASLAVTPYIFFLLWQGNNGNFFDYYLTPHFILLIPLIILGALEIIKNTKLNRKLVPIYTGIFCLILLGFFTKFAFKKTVFPINNAGIVKIDQAVLKTNHWIAQDGEDAGVIRVYTPNAETEHYDAFIHWRAKKLNREIPRTIKTLDDQIWYILIEPDYQSKIRQDNWYKEATLGGKLIKQEKIGDLTIEKWEKK